MNRKELRELAVFISDMNEGQVNAAISTEKLNMAIQYAYNREVLRLQQATPSWPWIRTAIVTWQANSPLCQLPDYITHTSWTKVRDITDTDNPEGYFFDPTWRDSQTWQWSNNNGPGY